MLAGNAENEQASTEYVEKDYVKSGRIEKRPYQQNLAAEAAKENCIVVLPTGLGKTAVALLVIAKHLSDSALSVLFLAPTRVLVNQHYEFLTKSLTTDDISIITGTDPVHARKDMWESRVVCATPEVARNDFERRIAHDKRFGLVVFDEVHRTVGDYAYSTIAKRLGNSNVRVLGMTATLPSEEDKADDIITKLKITKIVERKEDSRDVKEYTQETRTEWIRVDLPRELKEVRALLKAALAERHHTLKMNGLNIPREPSLSSLLRMREYVVARDRRSASPLFAAIRLHYACNLLESHGITPFLKFCKRTLSKNGVGVRYLFTQDPNVSRAVQIATEAQSNGVEHSKLLKLLEIINSVQGKVLVFTSYRDSVDMIRKNLKGSGVKSGMLIGKAGATGLKQKAQIEAVQKFRDGEYRVMVATRVGEEGLDIAEVNHVVFYDNVPSSIRYVQRRGRTGRRDDGNLTILIANGTIDESYYWIGKRKMEDASTMGAQMAKKLAKPAAVPAQNLDSFI